MNVCKRERERERLKERERERERERKLCIHCSRVGQQSLGSLVKNRRKKVSTVSKRNIPLVFMYN